MRRPYVLHRLLVGVLALALGCAIPPRAPAAPPAPAASALAASQTPSRAPRSSLYCLATPDDGVSPTYKPNAPVRSVVGRGHRLQGTVRSSRDCSPIASARVEVWPEIEGRAHPDESRATLITDANGRFTFECPQPEHIHMRVSAAGYRTIGSNAYHPDGKPAGVFDIVLERTGGS